MAAIVVSCIMPYNDDAVLFSESLTLDVVSGRPLMHRGISSGIIGLLHLMCACSPCYSCFGHSGIVKKSYYKTERLSWLLNAKDLIF